MCKSQSDRAFRRANMAAAPKLWAVRRREVRVTEEEAVRRRWEAFTPAERRQALKQASDPRRWDDASGADWLAARINSNGPG